MKKIRMQQTEHFIDAIKGRFTPQCRNLIYMASGVDLIKIKNHYANQKFNQFDNIVLVDKSHRVNAIIKNDDIYIFNSFGRNDYLKPFRRVINSTQTKNMSDIKGNIICLRADAIDAVTLFKNHNIKFDYFTAINEGVCHHHPLNNNAFYGYSLPIIQDEYYHLAWESYWKHIKKLPFDVKEKVELHHNDYVEVYSENNGPQRSLHKLSKRACSAISKNIGNVKVSIIRKSIWEDIEELSRMVFTLRHTELSDSSFWKKIQERYSQVALVNKGIINDFKANLLRLDENTENTVVGFTPLGLKGEYEAVLNIIEEHTFKNIKEIRLYHIDSHDYSEIRNRFL